LNLFALADSDVVVFLVPLLLATAGYGAILYRVAAARTWTWGGKALFVSVLTLLAGFLSFWWSMLLPINMYGT
jgi:predicted neutral ceramidase superfamily lipid hydrolase